MIAGASRNGIRDRFDARRRSFANWYASVYPLWPGYPYIIDPGFYDWGDTYDPNDQGAAVPEDLAPYPNYGEPAAYPQQEFAGQASPWGAQPAGAGSIAASPPLPEEPLTVIFKNGRAPAKMQNYMLTAKFLTDLDSRHYEQIPLNEIDIAGTQRANSAAGIAFEVPGTSRD
jgi:hypothetical protein